MNIFARSAKSICQTLESRFVQAAKHGKRVSLSRGHAMRKHIYQALDCIRRTRNRPGCYLSVVGFRPVPPAPVAILSFKVLKNGASFGHAWEGLLGERFGFGSTAYERRYHDTEESRSGT